MNKLSLGPITKDEPVKLMVTLPAGLKDDLDRYAVLHAETWGVDRLEAATLVPHILAAFLARDRGFRRARRRLAAGNPAAAIS